MFNVLIVDDEIPILEGIAKIVDWEGCGTSLVHKASSGQAAFELIKKDPPDIVITDIKMPGMSGVALIEKVHQLYPDIQFIVLSGYNEFDFAKTAMKYGVQHYLLKPSNEHKIQEALKDIVEGLTERKKKEHFLNEMKAQLNQMLPKAREQLLREFITNKKYGKKDWEHYQKLFSLPPASDWFVLSVLSLDDSDDYEALFALKEMITSELEEDRLPLFSTILSERIILLTAEKEKEALLEKVKVVKAKYKEFYHLTFTTAVSSPGHIYNLHQLYRETIDCLSQRFYVGNGGTITSRDIYQDGYQLEELQFEHEDLLFAVRNGNTEETTQYLEDFFASIKEAKYEVNTIKSHCLEMFMLLIRQAKKDVMNRLFCNVSRFQDFHTLNDIQTFMMNTSLEITKQNFQDKKQAQHVLVNEVEKYAKANLHNTSLSISKIANEVLYMNSDYLGKVFKKATGEKFSIYLMKLRMRKAIELILQSDEVMILEVAEKVGFGNNPRYFSQVFKKHTGYTPTEYKRIAN
ncbi:response regulator transcription factor [Sediminibacillus massiliensis]|uniref:response regulator transcription factor n=1 Tax=Sediminibacillus massiliensis TaxID=1926277 RepID=UPI0015C30A85|nr:response regulator [Sediminibacillus massiliensis]